jgi:ribosome-associated protein
LIQTDCTRRKKLEPAELAQKIVTELEDLKAEDIKLVDVTGKTPMCDFFILANILSPPQTQAITDRLLDITKHKGVAVRKVEGSPRSKWVLVDFGDVIVHLFGKEERLYYNLEELWEKSLKPPQQQS